MAGPELHPDLAPLAGLVGTWAGTGHGDYPTIEPFDYREVVTFGHVGKPFLSYVQRTAHASTGAPLHAEAGYLRLVGAPGDTAGAELTIAQPTGIAESHAGACVADDAGVVLDLRAGTVARTPSAKTVTSVRRRVVLAGDVLTYDLWMGHADTPETHHLRARLVREA